MIKNIKTTYFYVSISNNWVTLTDLNDNKTVLNHEDVNELIVALKASLHPQDFYEVRPYYNYKEASELYNDYFTQFCDPWVFDRREKQEARREFLRAFTRRNSDRNIYIDYAKEWLEECKPYEGAKSKVYDFELIKSCESIIERMENF